MKERKSAFVLVAALMPIQVPEGVAKAAEEEPKSRRAVEVVPGGAGAMKTWPRWFVVEAIVNVLPVALLKVRRPMPIVEVATVPVAESSVMLFWNVDVPVMKSVVPEAAEKMMLPTPMVDVAVVPVAFVSVTAP